MKVIHVGMGKTATSSLQAYIFPKLAEQGIVRAYNPRELHLGLDAALNGFGSESGLAALAAAQDRMLISNETLLEWDPALWDASANLLLRAFGPDVTILITLREPNDYLRSLYQQVLHSGRIRAPQDFYLSADTYRAARRYLRPGELDGINVDDFDMVRMVSIYIERFASVVLVPFEAIGELRFLMEIWGITEAERAAFARVFATAPRVNTSYSQLAVRLTLGRERVLARMGLRSRSASDAQFCKALAHARGMPLEQRKGVIPSWTKIMRLLSKHGPQRRYQLPDGLYLGRHQRKNAHFYAALRHAPGGHVNFVHGRAEGFDFNSFERLPFLAQVPLGSQRE